MARYLVTYTESYEVEADDEREATSVAEETRDLYPPDTEDVSVEIVKGIAV